jgi:hypothetical protein
MPGVLTLYRSLRARLRPVRAACRDLESLWLRHEATSMRLQNRSAPHGLSQQLIVSLTSYPPRFGSLHLSLRCLLNQTVRPDRVLLWIAHNDLSELPSEVLELRAFGLDIRAAPELRSFKKIIPALGAYPDAFIATADDDTFYPRRWLESLVGSYSPNQRSIPCGRVHRIVVGADGAPLRYAAWRHNIRDHQMSALNFATGVGGALFPPQSLHPDVTRASLFMRLCPTSDDAWLYWMARRAGWIFKLAQPAFRYRSWPGSQTCALRLKNAGPWGDNDRQIANLLRCLPLADFEPPGAIAPEPRTPAIARFDKERC